MQSWGCGEIKKIDDYVIITTDGGEISGIPSNSPYLCHLHTSTCKGGATLLPVATKAMHETHIEITYLAHNSIGWAPCHVVEKQAKDGGLHSRNRCSHAWSKLDCF
jgi:hypothetical protein